MKQYQDQNVFDASVERMKDLYEAGHRVIVSFSGGKDSGACLEICTIAAKETGRLPVEVIMRDEEIMFPGTFEYCERVYHRPNVSFHWVIARQPIINVFNRECPYFWVFDSLLKPSQWVRQPPSFAEFIPELNIEWMVSTKKYPPTEGKDLISVIGLRCDESRRRRWVISSAKGHLTKPSVSGVRNCYPIYDWKDTDVWKAYHDNHWDFNHAYTVMGRFFGMNNKIVTTEDGIKMRAMESKLKTAKQQEDRTQIQKDANVYRLNLIFTGEEASIVKKVLGERQAQAVLELCVERLRRKTKHD